jgi:acyl-CoA thioesterase
MNITFFAPTKAGDILTAEAKEIFKTHRTATYKIDVRNQAGDLIATCQALVYRKKENLPGLDNS